jgi:hypothetical protein
MQMREEGQETRAAATIRRFGGAILLAILLGSPASGRDIGKFSAGCLNHDSVLKNDERLPLDAAGVVTISPSELIAWQPAVQRCSHSSELRPREMRH